MYSVQTRSLWALCMITVDASACTLQVDTMPTDGQGDSRSRVTFVIFQLPCIVRRIQKYFQRLVHRKIGYQLYRNKPESLNYKYNEGCA